MTTLVPEQIFMHHIIIDCCCVLTACSTFADLPECFHEVQDYAIVPLSETEWDHIIDRGTLRLMGALMFVAPRPLEGKSFWRIPAEVLKNPVKFGEKLAQLKSVAAAPVEVHRTPTPDKGGDGDFGGEAEHSEQVNILPPTNQYCDAMYFLCAAAMCSCRNCHGTFHVFYAF